jgi:flagellar basal body rod protein FlgC
MSSYDLSPKSIIKMESMLEKLVDNNVNLLEFRGTQTVAVYLRQAMVAAEYLSDKKYSRLNKFWTISYNRSGVIRCTRKRDVNFREYKLTTGIVEALSILEDNQDAQVLYFPHVLPADVNGKVTVAQQNLLDAMISGYPDFIVTKFNHSGLVIAKKGEK